MNFTFLAQIADDNMSSNKSSTQSLAIVVLTVQYSTGSILIVYLLSFWEKFSSIPVVPLIVCWSMPRPVSTIYTTVFTLLTAVAAAVDEVNVLLLLLSPNGQSLHSPYEHDRRPLENDRQWWTLIYRRDEEWRRRRSVDQNVHTSYSNSCLPTVYNKQQFIYVNNNNKFISSQRKRI